MTGTMRVAFTADEIEAALATIRGSVTREESIVMAAAQAAAHVLRGGTLGPLHMAGETPPYVRLADPDAGLCNRCGHKAGGIIVGMEEHPHTCCGHPDCMVTGERR